MALPSLIVTGASGFLGRNLLETIKEDYQIYGIARRSQARSGAPVHPNIRWYQVDIGDLEPLQDVFNRIKARGGAETVVHFAAHYDFTGEEHPEYIRTNVEGHRNLFECCRRIGVRYCVFSSSVAACKLPPPGEVLDETSPPDGEHIYARTKRIGEEMLDQYRHEFRSVIIRFAAMFSSWCEYAPLYMFLKTWLSDAWNARLLGGRGETAIPFLHVHDAALFVRRVLDRLPLLDQGEVLVASPDGCTSHRQLFRAATDAYYGTARTPRLMPKAFCGPGMWARDTVGKLAGERPFERPWMARYIDTRMTIDSRRTRARLGWVPRERLSILARMPFMIEHLRVEPFEWERRNRAAMKQAEIRDNLRIYWLLVRHGDEIEREFREQMNASHAAERFPHFHGLRTEQQRPLYIALLPEVLRAILMGDRSIIAAYCEGLVAQRYHAGLGPDEVCRVLHLINEVALSVLGRYPEARDMSRQLREQVTMPLLWGCDQAHARFEQLEEARLRGGPEAGRGQATSGDRRLPGTGDFRGQAT